MSLPRMRFGKSRFFMLTVTRQCERDDVSFFLVAEVAREADAWLIRAESAEGESTTWCDAEVTMWPC
jgi:hypothetical protein